MKKIRHVITYATLFFLIACSKNDNKPSTQTAASKLVKKIVIHYSNIPFVGTTSFNYDNSGRLTAYREAEIDTTHPTNYTYHYYSFVYTGSNTQPDSYTFSDQQGKNYAHRIAYNPATSVPITDSVVSSNSTINNHETIKISFNNNIAVFKDYKDPGQSAYSIDSIWLNSDSNIVQHKMGTYDNNGTYRLVEMNTYNYTNYLNPMVNVRIATLNPIFSTYYFGYKNLPSSQTYIYYGGTTTSLITFQYSIDASGLVQKGVSQAGNFSSYIVFEYY